MLSWVKDLFWWQWWSCPASNCHKWKRKPHGLNSASINKVVIIIIIIIIIIIDRLFGIVVSTSDYHPRGPGFDSRLYPRNFSGSIGSGTGSTQPCEDNWVATWMISSEIRLRKLKLRLRYRRFANYKAPCTAIWQQPLQSVLALRGCSATDLI